MKGEFMNSVKRALSTAKMKASAHSPEIFLALGIAGTVAGAVVACVATVKSREVVANAKEELDAVDKASEESVMVEYTEEDRKKDLVTIYAQTGFNIAKLYLPAAALFGFSVASILHSHGLMKRRNAELMAACSALSAALSEYRARVRREVGDEKENEIYYGLKAVTLTDGEGKEHDALAVVEDPISKYAVYFEPGNPNWEDGSMSGNKMWLDAHERYATSLLCKKEGTYVFLNDIYKMLGFPITKEGQVVGWKYDPSNPDLQNYISFNIQRVVKPDGNGGVRHAFLLDFNVDGNVLALM